MSILKVIEQPKNSKIQEIIAVAAGKGGVGKSTIAVNLALAMKKRGLKVGLLDADIYGPSLEQMLPRGMGVANHPENSERILPAMTLGIPFISMAHFKKEASIVRAPIANQLIDQFLNTVEWGDLDVLVIDFPPGTGDIQLTLMQKAPLSCALMVTTPQVVATLDVRKAMQLFQRMEIPLLGVVENMSYFEANERHYPFGAGGGEKLCKEFQIPFLGQIPIDPQISEVGDLGKSLFEEEGKIKEIFLALSDRVALEMQKLSQEKIEVRQLDCYHLEFFINGNWKQISLHELQKRCPCARCAISKKCDEKVSLLEFSLVGRYAIRVIFSSGCSQGIYPLSLIRTL